MNSIPLPNELLHKVMGYILPIFEYAEYNQCIRSYNDTQLDMTLVCHDCQDMLYGGSSTQKLSILNEMMERAEEQKKYLIVIDKFLKRNPLFVRPDNSNLLNENQYIRSFDYQITEKNMERVSNNVMLRRGMWEYPDTKNEVLLYTDTVQLLFEGSIRDLVYSCLVNNVGTFRKDMENFYQKSSTYIWNFEIIDYINKHYSTLDAHSLYGDLFRKNLVSNLIKI